VERGDPEAKAMQSRRTIMMLVDRSDGALHENTIGAFWKSLFFDR